VSKKKRGMYPLDLWAKGVPPSVVYPLDLWAKGATQSKMYPLEFGLKEFYGFTN